MSQQDYDNIKQRLKDWMGAHPEEYDCFEAEMNSQNAIGYQKILSKSIALVPQYRKMLLKKVNQGMFDDISEIEKLFMENKLAQTLLKELECINKDTFVPAMLAWLYFGQSFERMVEIGEELRKDHNTGYLQKFAIASTIKILISKSVKLGLRTKTDWEKHRKLMKMVESDEVVDWAIESETIINKSHNKTNHIKINGLTLEEMIVLDDEKKQILLSKIEYYVKQGTKGKKIAWMILSLRQLGYLPNTTSDRHLFNAIREKFGLDIGSDKSIYAYLERITVKSHQAEIDVLSNYFFVD